MERKRLALGLSTWALVSEKNKPRCQLVSNIFKSWRMFSHQHNIKYGSGLFSPPPFLPQTGQPRKNCIWTHQALGEDTKQ